MESNTSKHYLRSFTLMFLVSGMAYLFYRGYAFKGISHKTKITQMEKYTYGAMSSKFELEAENKLTAYAAMVMHYNQSAHLMVIYSPEECKNDSWTTFDGKISERLHEIFGGNPDEYEPEVNDAFDKYIADHIDEVKTAYESIKRLV